jgi:hypothetical protein
MLKIYNDDSIQSIPPEKIFISNDTIRDLPDGKDMNSLYLECE